jgi:hypothetical protein
VRSGKGQSAGHCELSDPNDRQVRRSRSLLDHDGDFVELGTTVGDLSRWTCNQKARLERFWRRNRSGPSEKVSIPLPANQADSNTAILPAFVFDFRDRELPDFGC